jgi:hypothetical protein
MAPKRPLVLHLGLAAAALSCNGSRGAAADAGAGNDDACSTTGDGAPSSAAALATLEVELSGSPGPVLFPEFSPATTDYYVKCAEGSNAIKVSVKAAAGAEVSLAIGTPAKPKGLMAPHGATAAEQSLTLSVMENQAVVATAIAGSASQEYWIRCAPHDLSPMLWVAPPSCARTPGYYLVGNEAPPTGGVAYAMVLDSHGVPVWYTKISGTSGVYDVDQIVKGTLSFIPWPMTSGFTFIGFDPPAASILTPKGGVWLNPHELRALPDGHFLMLITTPQNGVNLTGFNVPLSDGGVEHYGASSSMLPCTILDVDSTGKVAWTWVGSDHIDPVIDNELPERLLEGGFLYPDPYHCNSIDVDPANGNLLVSARDEDSIFYIDRATSKILWKLGGSDATKDHAEFIPVAPEDAFHLQHDARLLPGWSPSCGGQVSVFDDESVTGSAPARAVVYDVTLGGTKPGGESCGKVGATVAWQYRGAKPVLEMGSVRVASDGSRLVGWGQGGVPGLIFTEVDAQGRDILDLYFTDGSASYRAVKLPTSALDIALLRSTASLPGP